MYRTLRTTLERILHISDENWNIFESILEEKKINRKGYLLRQGEISQGIYFLSEGCLRTFNLHESGKEINTAFYFEHEFLREIESLSNNSPSKKNIQALEECIVFYIDKNKLVSLYQTSPFYQELGRKILEEIAIREQEYSTFLTSYSPKERYVYILENRPQLIERIPLQFLASYLGISRESLSRIRSRI